MPQSCLDCAQPSDRVFCDLELDALKAFDGIKSIQVFPGGAVLFKEGQIARGVFLLCRGCVRLSVCSDRGRRMSLRVATSGEVLGLSAALACGSYEVTCEALEDIQVAVVRRKDLLAFLHDYPGACMHVVRLLSDDLHVAYERVREVGLRRPRQPRLVAAR